ncbi:MAG: LytTR family DNA-binding domain-containing protein [Bacteroidota bacterium]
MLTAVAIDDEPSALQVVQLHAAKVLFLELKASFTNAFEALHYLQHNPVDLLFLDIKMPDISGLELVKCLPRLPMVIFTTAYSEFAVEGFELDAVDYLLKPFSLARFTKACHKALEINKIKSLQEPAIFIKTGYQEEKVRLEEILYIEADGNYLTFVLPKRKVLSRQTMQEVLQLLPSHQFVRVHRSYIVALPKIDRITRQEIGLAGISIPIGASYEEGVKYIRSKLSGK